MILQELCAVETESSGVYITLPPSSPLPTASHPPHALPARPTHNQKTKLSIYLLQFRSSTTCTLYSKRYLKNAAPTYLICSILLSPTHIVGPACGWTWDTQSELPRGRC